MTRSAWLISGIVVLALAGCGSSSDRQLASRATKCTDELLRGVKPEKVHASNAVLRHYISVTYCERFARNGWVYDDGALSIGAQHWLVRGGREVCHAAITPGDTRTPKTIPCKSLDMGGAPQVIECAMLHHVRRSEVRTYIADLRLHRRVVCDDGTPLTALGVPGHDAEKPRTTQLRFSLLARRSL